MPLHRSQHAYRVNRSTETAHYKLITKIKKTLEYKKIVICTSAVMRKALMRRGMDSATVDHIAGKCCARYNVSARGSSNHPSVVKSGDDDILIKLNETGIKVK